MFVWLVFVRYLNLNIRIVVGNKYKPIELNDVHDHLSYWDQKNEIGFIVDFRITLNDG